MGRAAVPAIPCGFSELIGKGKLAEELAGRFAEATLLFCFSKILVWQKASKYVHFLIFPINLNF